MGERLRLQRYLASSGVSSRRGGETLILEGRISVNGEVVTELGTVVDPDIDIVRVDGRRVSAEKHHFYLYHKPPGILCTLDDPFGRPSLQQVTAHLPVRVFPIGRLDLDVFGLLLLTNDGQYAQKLLHPSFGSVRRYIAEVEGVPKKETLELLCQGVELEDGPGKALSAKVVENSKELQALFGRSTKPSPGKSFVKLSVGEGRNHFVKRILAEVSHPVLRLCRTDFGPYALGSLRTGEFKELKNWKE